MKLTTFLAPGGTAHIGALLPGEATITDFTAADAAPYFRSMLDLIDAGPAALDHARRLVERPGATHAVSAVARQAPLPQPRRLRDCLCFETHFRQSRANRYLFGIGTQRLDPASVELPRVWYERPIYYKGNPFSVVGDGTDVHWPAYSQVIDYELEIGMVTSRGGKNIPAAEAASHIFGYTIFNDFSARDAQYTEMQGGLGPAKGKDFDTGNAMGPWLVTADEIADPQALTMVTRVNGEEWSRGNSRDMHHTFLDILAYVSSDETLYAGEVLGSGTVGGGCGNELGRFLKHGDVLELEVSGLGTLRNRIVAPHVPSPPPFPIRIPV
ncbi:fumarylacetoacetate hydrolase family protein [Pigmentiphaga sp. H8]|uniref:fumarylacetoacetate hydrolase family protein n=1 Tax=Pigmentiphaga sp. H8 TaxID=2488560 RepID=UPI000F59C244|nr:fumarylacetoacetate hydrolase family protein [Pigmentiphaga sp. H8]AZG10593.1 fumarylacetoacetate hydrolase family protein [Pigmentiphaga sp. H8]